MTINNVDTINNEFNIIELDTTLVLIPLFNIENANAIFNYYNTQINNYEVLVYELDSINMDNVVALSFCKTALTSCENINLNLEKQIDEGTLLLDRYKRVNRISISIILLLLGGLALK